MSTNRQNFEISFDVYVGTTKELELEIIDPDTGLAKDITDTNLYTSGVVQILMPDETQIGADIPISFTERANSIILFTITSTHTTSANAGNWIGKAVFKNISSVVIDQQKFGLNILQ